MIKPFFTLAFICSFLLVFNVSAETQVSVKAALEQRIFTQGALYQGQHDQQLSAFVEPEMYHSWNDNLDSITFKSFYRWDQKDDERSHGDIRELMWLHVGDDWELRTGIGTVFWGQTESQHLVDVINQTDFVEALDGEDKLGQPMVNLTLIREWGNLDLFILPGFRERTFPGTGGRLRAQLDVKAKHAIYESSDEDKHVDYALRWSHTIDDLDVGVSYFSGTSRDPSFVIAEENSQFKLTPYYAQMKQIGIDLLLVDEAFLYKFEGIYRDSNDLKPYFAATAGFEYTTVGVFDSIIDLGWLLEYQYDNKATSNTNDNYNALMLGSRVALNDIDGTEVLIGYVQNFERIDSHTAFIEASSRINDHWKWRVDAWFLTSNSVEDITYSLRQDDFIQLSLEYYF